MGAGRVSEEATTLFAEAAAIAARFRSETGTDSTTPPPERLRPRLHPALPETGRPAAEVIRELAEAAAPGLVRSTRPGFLAWVIGASHPAGVAADWLTSAWGQNAGIYQCSPAAAVAEEACEAWLTDLLDLPRESSVGFVTGATMATFVCLAAARAEVLRRAGCDLDEVGLNGSPPVKILIGADAHVTNLAALRYLGFGRRDLIEIEADENGVMDVADLRAKAARIAGPAIVVAQAGHINSGAFDDFAAAAGVARSLGGWLHVDGAFGLWARAAPELGDLARSVELADSWAVDGHKWLQVPYDSGFAVVRDRAAHERAMAKSAGYLNEEPGEGRNPTLYNPELSRRARGFPVWAMLQTLGRKGIAELVSGHCRAARAFAERAGRLPGVRVLNRVALNQVALDLGDRAQAICNRLNRAGFFLRTADWRGRAILRISFCGAGDPDALGDDLADALTEATSGSPRPMASAAEAEA